MLLFTDCRVEYVVESTFFFIDEKIIYFDMIDSIMIKFEVYVKECN